MATASNGNSSATESQAQVRSDRFGTYFTGLPSLQQVMDKQLTLLDEAVTRYETSSSFSCSGSLKRVIRQEGTHYGEFTSKKADIKCATICVRWDGEGGASKKFTFNDAPRYRGTEPPLEDLVQDCEPATFGFNGKDVLDEAVRKAGKLEAHQFSTNFNPYDYGIVDTVARELLPGIVRAGRQPAVDRWGVVAELYKLNVYSGPSGMFKPHIDTPRGRTQFGSLVVCLPTEFKGGQLRVAHKGREKVFELGGEGLRYSEIKWAAFHSDCEHEVLPVTSGHRVTLTYQLYVSEHVGGLVQPKFPTTDSKIYPLYNSIKNMLSSHTFMMKGGILGFHCAYQYPESVEGTYYYARYPRTLKGTDAVLFTLFRAFGLTVHIKPYQRYRYGKADSDVNQISKFEDTGYVGDEIFQSVTWFNESVSKEGGKEYHEVASTVTNWIGNEFEIDWEYAILALLVVVPEFSGRELKDWLSI